MLELKHKCLASVFATLEGMELDLIALKKFNHNIARCLATIGLLIGAKGCIQKPVESLQRSMPVPSKSSAQVQTERAHRKAVALKDPTVQGKQSSTLEMRPAFIPSDILCIFDAPDQLLENSEQDEQVQKIVYVQEEEQLQIPKCSETQKQMRSARVEICPSKPSYLYCQESTQTTGTETTSNKQGESSERWICLCSGMSCEASTGFEILPSLPSCGITEVH